MDLSLKINLKHSPKYRGFPSQLELRAILFTIIKISNQKLVHAVHSIQFRTDGDHGLSIWRIMLLFFYLSF